MINFAELKLKLCEFREAPDEEKDDYYDGVKFQYEQSVKIISKLLGIIENMQTGLDWYHANAMTFKHCQEVCPDVEDYCSGDLAKGVLSETESKLKQLIKGQPDQCFNI